LKDSYERKKRSLIRVEQEEEKQQKIEEEAQRLHVISHWQ